jgi:transposase
MHQDGSILDTSSYPNTLLGASHYAKQMLQRHGECKAVIESTGSMCMKTYKAFESNGVEVKLANPVKTKAIASAKIKSGKVDARILEHLLRADLIAECYLPRGM